MMIELLKQSPVLFITAVAILGLLIGSFLNVLVYRLPIMMERQWKTEAAEYLEQTPPKFEPFDLVKPDSACPHCQSQIRAWQNIPVLSYILLGGKCANCKKPISVRYPVVETVTALLSGLIAWYFGWSIQTGFLLIFMWLTIALTLIDFDTHLLPDSLVFPLIWLGLFANLSHSFVPLEQAVVGAMAGYLSLWSIYWVFKILTGKEGMGYGDFKLLAAFGAWFGWQALPLIILLSALVGAVVGISLMVILSRDKNIPIPFGPYLCGAAWVYLFWGEAITVWYLGTL